MTNKPQDIFIIVRDSITEITGAQANEISLDSDLEEDLGIDNLSFPQIIKKVNEELENSIPLGNKETIDQLLNCATVAELVDVIEEETQY